MKPVCPFTNQPCEEPQEIKITEVENGKAIDSYAACEICCRRFFPIIFPDQESVDSNESVALPIEYIPPETVDVPVNIIPTEPPADEPIKLLTNPQQIYDFLKEHGIDISMPVPKTACPGCGLTLDEFDRTGRFGCPVCYDYYLEEFLALAGPFHNTLDGEHVGKLPKRAVIETETKEGRLKLLRLKIAKAVEMEQYEMAAKLKEEIAKLMEEEDVRED